MRPLVVFLAIVLFGTPVIAAQPAPEDPEGPSRPRIGLALGGGAARGIAHIGILQWLEEHRIPVDVIAGTSAGGLVGGAYATGLAPAEILEWLQGADWGLVFLSDSPFRRKTFRRKEDARDFPGLVDFGLKRGLKLPTGLNAGQQVELLLDHIALPYPDLSSFDLLPTRFRSVATDLRSGNMVVLDAGPLSRAMRATMAIPGVFTPVEIDGQLLIDGGTLNNVPADIARAAGADIVIAVNVSSSTDETAPVANLFSVLDQTLDVMMSRGVQAALKEADLVITPNLKGLSGMDWRRADEFERRGYEAAEAMRADLLPLAVDEAAWREWQQDRRSRRKVSLPPLEFVRVEGVGDPQQGIIQSEFERLLVGRSVNREEIEDAVLDLSGTDRYDLIRYRLIGSDGMVGLLLEVTPKSIGPPFLLPALDLSNVDSHAFALSARARVAFYDALASNTELRLDLAAGTRETAAVEVYRPVGRIGLFGSARGYFDRKPVSEYDDKGELVAEYREKRTGAGADVGWTDGRRHEVRLGFDVADVRTRVSIGEPSLPEALGVDRFASLRWTFDGQTSPNIPSRGIYSRATLKYYFAVPDLVSPSGDRQKTSDVLQAEVRLSAFRRWRVRHRLFVTGEAGTSLDDEPGYHRFSLGGPLRLGAYTKGRVTGSHYLLTSTGLLWQLMRLPDVLGGDAFLGGWVENGTAFDAWKAARYHGSVSTSLAVETILGVARLGGSVSVTDGSYRIYVALGPLDDINGIFR